MHARFASLATTLALFSLANSLSACQPQASAAARGAASADNAPACSAAPSGFTMRLPTGPEGGEVDAAWVRAHRCDVRIVDVREPDEFTGSLGHIAEASLVPLSTVGSLGSRARRDEPIVLVCRSGHRSGNAMRQLVAMGFTNVASMEGGMMAWNDQSLPVSRAP